MSRIKSLLPYENMISNPKSRSRYSHLVQFFDSQHETVSCVGRYAFAGLIGGEGIFIIGTEADNKTIEMTLARLEFDIEVAKKSKQLILLDAHATLAHLMLGKVVDRDLFFQYIGSLVEQMSFSFPLIRAYSEMVNILMLDGNFEAAIVLENLWNELGKTRSFSLLCGYKASLFTSEYENSVKATVCSAHTHVVPKWSGKIL